ncbi:dnaJ homolog subfamily C member 24 isoform X1 [Dunckerocampus dactyliophorus]|uniref:dnaJ homolog subfamily C member 24 isoform X1 n=1 Tax=Dunckerocampus dactyliophorus TaxID=161453 RepID=UPI0024050526|nr:dnaJ homolog subfamily C member 24 isoform X1 [Dunckerocampus dactyliophorus]
MAGDNNVCSGVSEAAEKDLYAVLGASPSDSFHELRHRYQKLALQCHPDRLGDVCDSEAESGMRMFLEIDAAWRILSDHSARRQYDQERRAQQLKQDWLVDSTVSVEDMTWNEEGCVYTYCCRCGGQFSITQEEMEAEMQWRQGANEEEEAVEGHHVVVCCNTCSLSVYVTYPLHSKASRFQALN